MGVPALFRWLSKKYPKIVLPVVEEAERKIPQEEDGVEVSIPIDISGPNPNGVEFDNLYLDMNGIVHPCTHPEGKPAPETEDEMMVEIFKYTERVVNMVRPRKLLFMAIDGVAPRAKMNQQRSRRFRSAQEAKEKEEAHKESLVLWQSMGKTISEEMKNKTVWDSNAITPGTPFMDLLAMSLRYWVAQKMNNDPGWKQMEVIISDASVPGEGEHKIMDFIRRQRTHSSYDPNTHHVIYGLDADLIMLSLATHEPHFRVLREDVFFQDISPTACRICGQEGHYAANCTGEKKPAEPDSASPPKATPLKPFIFLDVSILREYLEVELDVPNAPFQYDLERAIDDWVLLIFFVGNDFLPHLPSLEIREGAIDTLLRIWKEELPRMGGYVTNHGELEYDRLEIILHGLGQREDDIFRRRREAEERQDQNAKRRKIEANARNGNGRGNGVSDIPTITPSSSLQLTASPTAPPSIHGLPARPNFDSFESSATSLGLGAVTEKSDSVAASALAGITGSNKDWIANRHAIRLANFSLTELKEAERTGVMPANRPVANNTVIGDEENSIPGLSSGGPSSDKEDFEMNVTSQTALQTDDENLDEHELKEKESITSGHTSIVPGQDSSTAVDDLFSTEEVENVGDVPDGPRGIKRKGDELEDESDTIGVSENEEPETELEAAADDTGAKRKLKVNPDGTIEQEDTVMLWKAGYRERYYRQKFGLELSDTDAIKKITTAYVEGMAWVLRYYYQGTPSWQWYYPYHFAPFAADFKELPEMNIKFDIGQPFKPFEQLMGVFPASSRIHIPHVFHDLMTDTNSPIIDFYPEEFEIDMNGKKMAWQGVALLPFIDEKRLLDAMSGRYSSLNETEVRRNKWGNNVIFVSDEHPLYPALENLYTKKKYVDPVPIDPQASKALAGSVLPDPSCLPGSTYICPISSGDLNDIHGDRSLSALYFFPKQLRPHRSVLLRGVRRPPRSLRASDFETIRRGRGRGRGYGHDGRDNGRNAFGNSPNRGNFRPSAGYNANAPSGRGRGNDSRPPYHSIPPPRSYQPSLMGDHGRPANNYYQGGQYARQQPPPPNFYGRSEGDGYNAPPSHDPYTQGYNVPTDSQGGYGAGYGRGGYSGPARHGHNAPPFSNSYAGSGGAPRGDYGGYQQNRGGYRTDSRGTGRGGYGGYGQNTENSQYFGNYTNGAPPSGRGRGYNRY